MVESYQCIVDDTYLRVYSSLWAVLQKPIQARHGPTQRTLAINRGSLYTSRTDHVSIFIFTRRFWVWDFFRSYVNTTWIWTSSVKDIIGPMTRIRMPVLCVVLRPVPWPRILEPEFIMERLTACGAAFRDVGNGLTSSSYHGRIKDIIQVTMINVEDIISHLLSADLCDNST